MKAAKSVRIRTNVRAGAITKNHNARPSKAPKAPKGTKKLAAVRVRGGVAVATRVRAGACDGAAKDAA